MHCKSVYCRLDIAWPCAQNYTCMHVLRPTTTIVAYTFVTSMCAYFCVELRQCLHAGQHRTYRQVVIGTARISPSNTCAGPCFGVDAVRGKRENQQKYFRLGPQGWTNPPPLLLPALLASLHSLLLHNRQVAQFSIPRSDMPVTMCLCVNISSLFLLPFTFLLQLGSQPEIQEFSLS